MVQDNTTAMRNDGNNVDPDREMALVAENQLYYQALVEAVSRKLSSLRSAITEGELRIYVSGAGSAPSGLTAERLRMDTIANSLANAETTYAEGGPYR